MLSGSAINEFNQLFVVEMADSPALVREAQRIRHQVFCVERGIIPQEGRRSLETDEYDVRSSHVIVRQRASRDVVGTVRVIRPDPGQPADSLPMHRVCDVHHLNGVPLRTAAEISRFALSKDRRDLNCSSDGMLKLALMRGVWSLSLAQDLTHWCAVMERSLVRMLRRFGIHFVPAGPLVEHYGLRQPCVAQVHAIAARVRRDCPAFASFVSDSVRVKSPDFLLAA